MLIFNLITFFVLWIFIENPKCWFGFSAKITSLKRRICIFIVQENTIIIISAVTQSSHRWNKKIF